MNKKIITTISIVAVSTILVGSFSLYNKYSKTMETVEEVAETVILVNDRVKDGIVLYDKAKEALESDEAKEKINELKEEAAEKARNLFNKVGDKFEKKYLD